MLKQIDGLILGTIQENKIKFEIHLEELTYIRTFISCQQNTNSWQGSAMFKKRIVFAGLTPNKMHSKSLNIKDSPWTTIKRFVFLMDWGR